MTRGIFAAVVALVLASHAYADDTARKTNDVLSSVAGIARNLELADVPSPIDITSDRLEFLYGQGVLRYEGNVRVEHAGAKIRAQTLEVSFEPEGKRSLKKITARGGVEVLNGDESARGEVAEYDPIAATIVLSQNARLGSGPNSLSGEKVIVYLNERRAVVTGGGAPAAPGTPTPADAPPSGRIKAVFMPDAIDRKPADAKPADPKPGEKK
ncbi:MAG: LptA/OstA family protein [Candidatus Binatia bacterium]